jgi:hypothetical protein
MIVTTEAARHSKSVVIAPGGTSHDGPACTTMMPTTANDRAAAKRSGAETRRRKAMRDTNDLTYRRLRGGFPSLMLACRGAAV